MNDYLDYIQHNGLVCINTGYLEHHGVKGMKWGVRNENSNRYKKIKARQDKYVEKMDTKYRWNTADLRSQRKHIDKIKKMDANTWAKKYHMKSELQGMKDTGEEWASLNAAKLDDLNRRGKDARTSEILAKHYLKERDYLSNMPVGTLKSERQFMKHIREADRRAWDEVTRK